MGSPHLIGPPAPREEEATHIEWQKVIPRWALLLALGASLTTIGWLWGRLDRAQDNLNRAQEKQMDTLQASTKNAAALYVSQLSERVATLEADGRGQKDWNADMTRAMKGVTTSNERILAKLEFILESQRRLTR